MYIPPLDTLRNLPFNRTLTLPGIANFACLAERYMLLMSSSSSPSRRKCEHLILSLGAYAGVAVGTTGGTPSWSFIWNSRLVWIALPRRALPPGQVKYLSALEERPYAEACYSTRGHSHNDAYTNNHQSESAFGRQL